MAIADLPEVYGGPYGDEIDAFLKEVALANATNRTPDFDTVTANWKTISAGAKSWLENHDKVVVPPVGKFNENVDLTEVTEITQPEKVDTAHEYPEQPASLAEETPETGKEIPVITADEIDLGDEPDFDEEEEKK